MTLLTKCICAVYFFTRKKQAILPSKLTGTKHEKIIFKNHCRHENRELFGSIIYLKYQQKCT